MHIAYVYKLIILIGNAVRFVTVQNVRFEQIATVLSIDLVGHLKLNLHYC